MWSRFAKMATREVPVEVDDIRDIFRKVAPLTVRYWKDIGRELGLQEEDFLEIEHSNPMARLSELAYQMLCLWQQKQGRNATKEKLVQALRELELKRAEESISHFVVRKSQSPRRNSSFGNLSRGGRRRTSVGNSTGKGKKPPVPSNTTSLTPRAKTAARNPKSIRKRHNSVCSQSSFTSTQSRSQSTEQSPRDQKEIDEDMREPGEVHAILEVTELEGTSRPTSRPTSALSDESAMETDENQETTWNETYQKMMLHYYTNVVKNAQDHINALNTLLDFKDVFVKQLKLGSVVIVFVCQTVKAVQNLQECYNSQKLQEICKTTFCNESILAQLNISSVAINLTIDPKELNQCHKELILKRPKTVSAISLRKSTTGEQQTTRNTLIMGLDVSCRNKSEYISSLKNYHLQIKEDMRFLWQRYRHFEGTISDFMMMLQLVKPVSIKIFKNISQLRQCLEYLQKTQSIGKQVRTDLIQELLDIVTLVHTKVDELEKKVAEIEGLFGQLPNSKNLSAMELIKNNLKNMLSPNYDFSRLSVMLSFKLTILERPMFSGLVSYVPVLLNRLGEYCTHFGDFIKELEATKVLFTKLAFDESSCNDTNSNISDVSDNLEMTDINDT